LRRPPAMLLASFGRHTGTLSCRSVSELRLRARACFGPFSRSAVLTICTLGDWFLVPPSGTHVWLVGLHGFIDLQGSSKRTCGVAVSKRDWRPEGTARSLSNRRQITPQEHSRPVEVRSECRALLDLSASNHQPSASINAHFRAIVPE